MSHRHEAEVKIVPSSFLSPPSAFNNNLMESNYVAEFQATVASETLHGDNASPLVTDTKRFCSIRQVSLKYSIK